MTRSLVMRKVFTLSEVVRSSISPPAITVEATAATNRTISESPALLYLASLGSDESRRAMRGCLERMVVLLFPQTPAPPEGWLAAFRWDELRYGHTALIGALLRQQVTIRKDKTQEPWSTAYINKHLSALSGVLKQAWKLGLMNSEDYHRAIHVDRPKGTREPTGRSIGTDELSALLAAAIADGPPIGPRDAAIIALLYSTGLRRSEVASAKRARYNPGDRSLRIVGKGDKERTVYLTEDSARYVATWLILSENIRGPLFCAIDRWGNLNPRPLDPSSIAAIIERRRRAAGLPKLTPHDFRRTFAGDLLDTGADLVQVRDLLGHHSADITAGYDRRPARQRKAAVDRLQLPEPRPLRSHESLPHDDSSET